MGSNIFLKGKKSVNGKVWAMQNAPKRIVDIMLKHNIFNNSATCKVAFNRGLTPEDIKNLINIKLKNSMKDPYILKDMEKACSVTLKHLQKGSKIAFFSDYDVDGMTSLACADSMFSQFYSNYIPYIPNRYKEGYGLSEDSVDILIKQNVNLIICLDNGSTCFNAIKKAKENNIDVVVIDHHAIDAKTPPANALVNPKQIDDDSGFDYMCAAGLTFMFLVALNRMLENEGYYKANNIEKLNLLNLLGYVALGTMCDIVPLCGLNRVFVKQGLEFINKTKPAWAVALANVCKIKNNITAQDLAFGFGPRINAPSRMGMALLSYNLLKAKEEEKAIVQALEIENINDRRKLREDEITTQAITAIKHQLKGKQAPCFIMEGSTNWEKGIIGIIASKIKDEYNKVAIIYCNEQESNKATASARSVLGVDIGLIIGKLNKTGLLLSGGGHMQAGGFSFNIENLDKIKSFIATEIEKAQQEEHKDLNMLYFDDVLPLSKINANLFDELSILEPYGSCFPAPLFVLQNVTIYSCVLIGKHKNHVRCTLTEVGNKNKYGAVAFKVKGGKLEKALLKQGSRVNIACGLSSSYYNGVRQINIIIYDVIEEIED